MPNSNSEETAHPGAGTLYVYGSGGKSRRGFSPSPSPAGRGSRQSSRSGLGRRGKGSRESSPMPGSFARWDDLVKLHEDPVTAATSDSLLRHGIAEYTYIPRTLGGVLGRGKFSTVYKVLGADGAHYALKHTPLYPHHPLISARLLREPTLLAELPSHPCLIGVEGWVRTEGHFYLIEQYAASHVPLSSITTPMQPSRAAYILDQLVSVIRDTLHEKGRVCHRDLKGDNVLVDVDTGEILILDLGLATRFSASEPKLTTCCGSPAFHSPEIVLALARPPGEVTYYGPELDIWCIALTLLSLLLQVRFPLGPKHTSTHVMRERVLDRLQELDELYPPHAPWRPPRRSYQDDDITDYGLEKTEWSRVRRALRDFLDIDGKRRMEKFNSYSIGEKVRQRVEDWEIGQEEKKFKSVSFIPAETKYTLPIYLEDESENHAEHDRHAKNNKKSASRDQLIMLNPANESERRIKSYIKYLLRSAGILYHLLPSASNPSVPGTPTTANPTPTASYSTEETIFQLVVPVSSESAADHPPSDPQTGWFPSLFSFGKKTPVPASANTAPLQTRSVSLPPSKRGEITDQASSPIDTSTSAAASAKEKSPSKMLRCYIKLEFVQPPPGQHSPTVTADWRRRGSVETFTSIRGGWEGGSTALRQVTSNGSGIYSAQGGNGSVKAKNYTFPPPRSASANRPSPVRPMNRRSVSHAPSAHATRQQLTRITTGDQTGTSSAHGTNAQTQHTATGTAGATGTALNHALTMSPINRQVSLPPSPTQTDPDSAQTTRAPSRASSRSRKASGNPTVVPGGLINTSPQHAFFPIQQTWSHHSASGHRQDSGSGGQIIIHLSDPRAYSAIKKALSVKPPSPVHADHRHSNGRMPNDHRRGSTDLSLLSPMTIRRPSLAPSLSMSAAASAHAHGRRNGNGARTSDSEPEHEDRHHSDAASGSGEEVVVNRAGVNGKSTRGLGIVNSDGQHTIRKHLRTRKEEEEEAEEEEERGRPRSKEDTSSMLLHLQKVKSRNSAKSSKSSKLYLHQTSGSAGNESDGGGVEPDGTREGDRPASGAAKVDGHGRAQLNGPAPGEDGVLKAEIRRPVPTPSLPTPDPDVDPGPVQTKQKAKDRSRSSSRSTRSTSRSRSRAREQTGKSRGLFDVLFGHNHNNHAVRPTAHSAGVGVGADGTDVEGPELPKKGSEVNGKSRKPATKGYGGNGLKSSGGGGSGSGTGSAGSSGYGRAARARSVPPYLNVNELVQHHYF
ncbi:hypothetical protein IAU59_003947 [Kwoniella sp. CBS 9459]